MRRLTLTVAALLLALVPVLSPAGSASEYFGPNGRWAGWVTTGGGFTYVSAGWTVPAVTCGGTQDRFAAWVGIDGYGSNTVEQVGTRATCQNGYPQYNAWTEMYPAPPVFYDSPGLYPGDVVTATVSRNGDNYTLTLANRTRGWQNSTTQYAAAAASSAEAVLESPTHAYPAFGSLQFTTVRVNQSYLTNYGNAFPVSATDTAGVIAEPGALQPNSSFVVYDDAH